MDGHPQDNNNRDKGREAVFGTVAVLVIIALLVPLSIHVRRDLACGQAAREFIEYMRQARSSSGQIEGHSTITFISDGREYRIDFLPGVTRTIQVSHFFMGTRVEVPGGDQLVFFVQNVDGEKTSIFPEMDHQQNYYYPVNFINGRTVFQVRVYSADEKLVKNP